MRRPTLTFTLLVAIAALGVIGQIALLLGPGGTDRLGLSYLFLLLLLGAVAVALGGPVPAASNSPQSPDRLAREGTMDIAQDTGTSTRCSVTRVPA